MKEFLGRLSSRKFIVAAGGVLVALGAAMEGEVEWGKALLSITSIVVAYMGIEGAADFQKVRVAR